MKLLTLPVADITPAPYNPRVALTPGSDEYRRLARSLDEFDLVQPMVWNRRTGHLVSGHQRLALLIERGVETVPAVEVDLPLEKEQALNVTLNNRTVGSDWDAEKLIDLVAELDALPDFDATLTGFDEDVLKGLLFTPDPSFEPESEGESDAIEVHLRIAPEQWPTFRLRLDELLCKCDVEIHISGAIDT